MEEIRINHKLIVQPKSGGDQSDIQYDVVQAKSRLGKNDEKQQNCLETKRSIHSTRYEGSLSNFVFADNTRQNASELRFRNI